MTTERTTFRSTHCLAIPLRLLSHPSSYSYPGEDDGFVGAQVHQSGSDAVETVRQSIILRMRLPSPTGGKLVARAFTRWQCTAFHGGTWAPADAINGPQCTSAPRTPRSTEERDR